MDEIHNFTMESETLDILLNEIKQILSYVSISEQTGIDLINMAEALGQAKGMRVTFNI